MAEHKTEGVWALEAAEFERRKKLIGNLQRIDWEISDDIQVGEEPVFDFPDAAAEARHRTLKGQAGTVSNLVEARSIRNL